MTLAVFNVYKPVGLTPLQALEKLWRIKPELENTPLTYAGRLDPMAEGVLLVLAGDYAKKREEYLGLDKSYQAEVLFGFETDTGDILGKVTSVTNYVPEIDAISVCLKKLEGIHVFQVPAYSSVPVKGKSLFEWAREGRLAGIEIPAKEMNFYTITLQADKELLTEMVRNYVFNRVASVSGDFRQDEIAKSWQDILKYRNNYKVVQLLVTCSSGSYIRSLVGEMGKILKSKAILYGLVRTHVGNFGLSDSIKI